MFNKIDIPIIDAHIHVMGGIKGIEYVKKQKENYGYKTANILSIQAMGDLAQNAKCIAYKLISSGDYAFAGLDYKSEKDFLTQAKELIAMGYDGFKMIEGKPDVRKRLGIPLCDPIYDPFYSYLVDNNLPLLLHAADPAAFWDADKTPDFAKENGWFYGDGTHLTKEEIYGEVESMLLKHKGLKVILAHFYFMSEDLERAGRLFDEFPNVYLDVTPGTEMFTDFIKDIAASRSFFEKYQDRIIFGTDNYDVDNKADEDIKDVINNLLHMFLCSDEEFFAWDLKLHGIKLSEKVLEKILYKNFLSIVKEPHQVDSKRVLDYCKNYISTLEDDKFIAEIQGVIDIAEGH